ncbi:ORF6N domain-containing protein [Xanthobacter sediminis]
MTDNEYRNPASVSIAGTDVRVVTYKGEPVVTFAMVDAIHQRPDGTAGRTFRENRDRFIEGDDFVRICADEIRRHKIIDLSPKAREDVTFLTRRGYLKLVKPLTDDRAWEVQGEMIDRYFAVEKIAAMAPEVLEMIRRDDGISRMLAHKVTEQGKVQEEQGRALAVISETLTALAALVQPSVPGLVIRHGKTAGAILKANGFTGCPTRLALWFGNRLEAAGCRVEGRLDTGTSHARLFDPDKAEAWLENGGRQSVEMKLLERKGQGALALTGRDVRQFEVPPDMREGLGLIVLNGEPVFYDIRDTSIGDGDRAVMIIASGEVVVDRCRPCEDHRGMGPRSVMCAPRPEILHRRAAPVPVEWQGVILGKVVERRNVIPLPAREHAAH